MIKNLTYRWHNGICLGYSYIYEPDESIERIGEILTTPKFSDIIFKYNVKEAIKLILEKAKTERFNLLFYGQQGTGKTTIAKMMAVELKKPFIYLNGSMGKEKVYEILTNAKNNSLILIDEIHSWRESIAEIIYPAIQDNELILNGKTKKINCMFIATTTEPERLSKPLLDRFKQIEIEELEGEQLTELLKKKGCEEKAINLILNYTQNFRIINNLLELIKIYGEVNELNTIKVFHLKNINAYSGLSKLQEKYLDYLKSKTKPIGLRLICLYLRKSEDYIKLEVENELIRKNMIIVTSKGREINPDFKDFGYEQLKKESEKSHTKFTQEDKNTAINWLKEHKKITEKLGSRYLELVNEIAELIHNGDIPDIVDWASFGIDKPIKDSFKDNYICEL